MYFALFRASEQAVRLLQEAQARAEEEYLRSAPPPLRLPEPPSPPQREDGQEGGTEQKADGKDKAT